MGVTAVADHICANQWEPGHPYCDKCGSLVEPPYHESKIGLYATVVGEDKSITQMPLEFVMQLDVEALWKEDTGDEEEDRGQEGGEEGEEEDPLAIGSW